MSKTQRAVGGPGAPLPPWAWPFLLLAILLFIIPVYLMVKVSVSSPGEVLTAHPSFWIKEFTPRHWQGVLSSGYLWPSLKKSLSVATGSALGTLLIVVPGAYAISRLPGRWRRPTVLALFFTRMFPDVGIALPIAVRFIKWNLLDNDLGLILAHLTLTLPFTAWVLVGTFNTVPRELEEASHVDGAGRLRTLWQVVLPLAAPGVAVATLLAWLTSWNEFTLALYLSLSKRTLPLLTYYYIGRGSWFQAAAYSAIITVPVLFLTYFLQRYLKGDYLAGGIKG